MDKIKNRFDFLLSRDQQVTPGFLNSTEKQLLLAEALWQSLGALSWDVCEVAQATEHSVLSWAWMLGCLQPTGTKYLFLRNGVKSPSGLSCSDQPHLQPPRAPHPPSHGLGPGGLLKLRPEPCFVYAVGGPAFLTLWTDSGLAL